MTRFESAPLVCPSRPKVCPSHQRQVNEVMTRFESAPLVCSSRPDHLSVGPASGQPSDDSIRVSTSCLPTPAGHQANKVMTRFESAPRACPNQPKTCLSDGPRTNEVMTRFESSSLACPSWPPNLSVGPASSQRSDDLIRVSTSCLPKPAGKNLSARPKSHRRSDDSSQHLLLAQTGRKTCL
jgi:hypothetical protein